MPSHALLRWQTESRAALDQIKLAHKAVGGGLRGRRYATLHINHAYVVLVSAHFQRFCRELHSEAIECACRQSQGVAADPRRDALRYTLALNRQLDTKNPSPSAIGADFNRFNLKIWDAVAARSPVHSKRRQALLERLNQWRNAIAHQDFATPGLRPESITLAKVQGMRNACDNLAERFDEVLAGHLATMIGVAPW